MSPREIVFRLKEKMALTRERAKYRSGAYLWSNTKVRQRLCSNIVASRDKSVSELLHHQMRCREEPPFLLDTTLISEVRDLFDKIYPERVNQIVKVADSICEGKFSFLGTSFTAPDPIQWQRDPVTGNNWGQVFYADVPVPFCSGRTRAELVGDPKIVWELNRHEFLIDCGKAYCLTEDSRYAKRVVEVMTSWIECNPYLQGINWAGPLEVAVRSLSWIWAYQLCRSWMNRIDSKLHSQIIKSFYEHGAFLFRHLEVYASPNNHLVGEALTLYFLGSFFPEFDESMAWRQRGWKILEAEPANQFYDDGGSTEQATFYHNYCLGFFLLAILMRRQQGRSISESMLTRIERALEFTMWITQPNGLVPRIGDVDDARSIRFENPPLWDFRNLISLGATVFGRSDMKALSGGFSEDALWLLGKPGYEKYTQLGTHTPQQTSKLFPQSGYGIARSGWEESDHFFCFDGGPIAKGLHSTDIPSSAHGHADVLSFTADCFGRSLIVDGGFYTYNGDPEWHKYFRETQSHNTIRVDGASQAKFNPSNAWSSVATPDDLSLESDEQLVFVECSHAGFNGLPESIRHRRAIAWIRKSYWLIFDRLEGKGVHDIEIYFHSAPGDANELSCGKGMHLTTTEGLHAKIESFNSVDLEMAVAMGGAEPNEGWIATSYGCKVAAPVVTFRGRLELPVDLCFAVTPGIDALPETSFRRIDLIDAKGDAVPEGQAWEIEINSLRDTLCFSWDGLSNVVLHSKQFRGTTYGDRIGLSNRNSDSHLSS